jgi:hypothetical protein
MNERRYLRCARCRTFVLEGPLLECYVCHESLEKAARVTFSGGAEPQVRRDFTAGTIVLCLLAGLGAITALSGAVALEDIPVGWRLCLLVPGVLLLAVGGFVLRFSSPRTREAGRTILALFAVLGGLVVLAVAVLICCFVACTVGVMHL